MHIDWFVLCAQVINFLILVFLLKYLLYDRIVNAMDAREQKITGRYAQAEAMQAKAGLAHEEFLQKSADLDSRRQDLINQAQAAARQYREELMRKAGVEVDELRARWVETLEHEKQSFLEELRRRAGVQIFTTIRRILRELADTGLEERILDVLEQRLHQMDGRRRASLMENLAQADALEGVLVRSGFVLTREQEERIIAALEPYAPQETPIRFESAPGLIAGMEILVHGHKIAWGLSNYLAELEEAFETILKEEIPDEARG